MSGTWGAVIRQVQLVQAGERQDVQLLRVNNLREKAIQANGSKMALTNFWL